MVTYPRDWNSTTFGKSGSFIKGAPLSKADISDTGTPFVLYGELYTTYGEVTYKIHRRTSRTVEPEYYSRIGDVIIPTSGETAEEIATSCCIMVPGAILAGDLNIYRADGFDGRYISYVINHVVNRQISEVAQGISIIHVNAKEIKKIEFFYPNLLEQKAIADVLDDFDVHINNLSELIDKKKGIRDGALEDLVSGRTRVDGFDGEWTELTLGDFLKIGRGASPRPIDAYLTQNPNGVNWIKIGDAPRHGKYIVHTEEKITPAGASHSVPVSAGDFILSNSMSFGRPYILSVSGCIHDGWLKLYDYQSSADKEFLYYLLSSATVKEQYETYAAGSGVQNLNKNVVKQVVVQLPSVEEQRVIASVLSSMDSEIDGLEDEREKMIQIREGVMDDLLTGRVRLSV